MNVFLDIWPIITWIIANFSRFSTIKTRWKHSFEWLSRLLRYITIYKLFSKLKTSKQNFASGHYFRKTVPQRMETQILPKRYWRERGRWWDNWMPFISKQWFHCRIMRLLLDTERDRGKRRRNNILSVVYSIDYSSRLTFSVSVECRE